MYKIEYNSPFGPLAIISHGGKLVYCNWVGDDCEPKLQRILKRIGQPSGHRETDCDRQMAETAITRLEEYFRGERKKFELPLHLYGTPFQKKVWRQLEEISYATFITYSELAVRCGNREGARAVARACGANPVAVIIGCHRVVGKNGKMGGYTGGIEKKIRLLKHELSREEGLFICH